MQNDRHKKQSHLVLGEILPQTVPLPGLEWLERVTVVIGVLGITESALRRKLLQVPEVI